MSSDYGDDGPSNGAWVAIAFCIALVVCVFILAITYTAVRVTEADRHKREVQSNDCATIEDETIRSECIRGVT